MIGSRVELESLLMLRLNLGAHLVERADLKCPDQFLDKAYRK
jgi:hypothetical protein